MPRHGVLAHVAPAVGSWSGAPIGATVVRVADTRANRRVQAVDLAAFFAAAAVLGSLFMPWYQFAFSAGGASISVSITVLSSHSGDWWRVLMLYLSIGVMVEILAKSVVVWVQGRAPWPHRALLAILCLLNLVLVAGAMIVAPFRGRGSLGLLNASLGPGAYVAIVGALVGIVAAAMLLVTGPPALTR